MKKHIDTVKRTGVGIGSTGYITNTKSSVKGQFLTCLATIFIGQLGNKREAVVLLIKSCFIIKNWSVTEKGQKTSPKTSMSS